MSDDINNLCSDLPGGPSSQHCDNARYSAVTGIQISKNLVEKLQVSILELQLMNEVSQDNPDVLKILSGKYFRYTMDAAGLVTLIDLSTKDDPLAITFTFTKPPTTL